MWLTPIRTKLGKLLLFIGLIPTFVVIFLIDWKNTCSNNKIMFILEVIIISISFIYAIIFDLKGNLDKDVEKLFDLFSNISK